MPLRSKAPADLEHLLLEHELAPPLADEVGLHGAAHGPVVVQPVDAAVDGEGLVEEEAPLEQVLQFGAVDLLLARHQRLHHRLQLPLPRFQVAHRPLHVDVIRLTI